MKQCIIDHFWYFINIIQFKYCRIKANRLHYLTGKRYFVIPKSKYSLGVVDNDYVRRYNMAAMRLKYKKITIVDLLKDCYYCTEMGTTGKRNTKPRYSLSKRGVTYPSGY